MWGYTIPSDADPIRWFKLLLLREEDLASELRNSEFLLRGRKMLRESEKTAVDLIADYLRALWRHILDTIQKARGKAVVEGLSFHVVITVPAIWKDYARQGMGEAARKSGILDSRPAGATTLAFAPEPEAAALASICESGRKVDAGDVFVICDAGGGTVVSQPKAACFHLDNLRSLIVGRGRISSVTKWGTWIQLRCVKRSLGQVRSLPPSTRDKCPMIALVVDLN